MAVVAETPNFISLADLLNGQLKQFFRARSSRDEKIRMNKDLHGRVSMERGQRRGDPFSSVRCQYRKKCHIAIRSRFGGYEAWSQSLKLVDCA